MEGSSSSESSRHTYPIFLYNLITDYPARENASVNFVLLPTEHEVGYRLDVEKAEVIIAEKMSILLCLEVS